MKNVTPERSSSHRADWILCIVVGVTASVLGVVGFNIYTCNGIPEAILWTLVMAALFVFVPPVAILGFILSTLVVTLATRSLSTKFSGNRIWLLAIALSATCLFAANGLALVFDAQQTCRVGTWN